ncbi:MAG: hypothetical protein QNK04_08360 [Myxococcota bacterium]|nr:hypothetical protein [Myxococcota bacterium]
MEKLVYLLGDAEPGGRPGHDLPQAVLDESTGFEFKGRRFRVEEVYPNSADFVGGSTVQPIESPGL